MSNKLRDFFSSNDNVASDGIKRIINQAYDGQWCTTCKNVYYTDDLEMKCSISKELCSKRQWSPVDSFVQLCLFYESKRRK